MLQTIAFSGDDGALAGDKCSESQKCPEQIDASSNELDTVFSRRRASLQRLRFRLRTLGCFLGARCTFALVSQASARSVALLLDLQCDLPGSPQPKICPTENH